MADSIREALTKAVAEKETEVVAEELATTEPTAPVETVAGSSASEETPSTAVETVATVDATSTDTKQTTSAATKTDPSQGSAPKAPQAPSPVDPAPGSWKAEEKAAWATLPQVARDAIKRREAEMSRVVGMSAEARRHHQEYGQVMHVFQPLLDAKGIRDPLNEVVKPTLQIRAALEIGSPEQKARIIADMIRDFQVDPEILNEAFNKGGSAPRPVAAPAPKFDPRAVPELAPLFTIAEQLNARVQAKADEAVASVESQPHYEAVREDMADIMERFALAGRSISIQEAYNRAVALNPELAQVPGAVTRPQVSASEAAAILARSRKAASSVSGAPKTGVGSKPTTLRDQIAAAMDNG